MSFKSRILSIVCVSDTHGEDPTSQLPPGDIFVHAGDLTDPGSVVELQKAYKWITKLSHPIKVVVAGNHDLALDPKHRYFDQAALDLFTSPEALSCGIHYLDHRTKTIATCGLNAESGSLDQGHLKIYGNPSQPDFLKSDYAFTYLPWPSQDSEHAWNDAPAQVEAVPLWISHGPPKGHLDWIDIEGLEGCEAQRRKIASRRPLLCIFGHYHVSYGVEAIEWSEQSDEIVRSRILTITDGVPEYDFSGEGTESPLRPGRDTLFVNAAWMTGRKREVEKRNAPPVIKLKLNLAASEIIEA